MPSKRYKYELEGTGGNGQTWKTNGLIECPFDDILYCATLNTFEQLTEGKAVFGKPGVGCNGPYEVTKLTFERLKGE